MKKLLVVLVAMAMLLSAFCFAEEADLTGVWYLSMVAMEEQTMNAADLGMDMTLTLNADGTAAMESVAMDVSEEGSWTADGNELGITFDGETAPASYEEGYLLLASDDEMQMVFSREEPAAFAAPAAVAAADITDFDGTWTMTMVDAYGMVVNAEMVLPELETLFGGSEPTVIIENGVVTAFGSEEGEQFAFEDGQLVLAGPDIEDTEISLDQFVTLNEDGTIAYTVMGMIFYCE